MTPQTEATAEGIFDSTLPTSEVARAANLFAGGRFNTADDSVSGRWAACVALATAGLDRKAVAHRLS